MGTLHIHHSILDWILRIGGFLADTRTRGTERGNDEASNQLMVFTLQDTSIWPGEEWVWDWLLVQNTKSSPLHIHLRIGTESLVNEAVCDLRVRFNLFPLHNK